MKQESWSDDYFVVKFGLSAGINISDDCIYAKKSPVFPGFSILNLIRFG